MTNTMKRTFQFRTRCRAGEYHGAIDTVTTETLELLPDGRIKVTTVVNQRHEKIWPLGPTMESCAQYRLTHGYTEVV